MTRLVALIVAAVLYASPVVAERIVVQPGDGALVSAVAHAAAGDEVILSAGQYSGPLTITVPLRLSGAPGAVIDGAGQGSVITIDAADVTVTGLTVTGSGRSHDTIDAGLKLTKKATRARVIDNDIVGNLVGVDIHGARDALVKGNWIEGLRLARMNDRGNGIYVWNAPGSVVEDNEIRYGRDGIFFPTRRGTIPTVQPDARSAVRHPLYVYQRQPDCGQRVHRQPFGVCDDVLGPDRGAGQYFGE